VNSTGYALGVDLGTSNTVAMLRWPDGRSRPLLFDGVPVMPSAVYLDPSGALHVGRDALRMATLDPARLEPNPKRRVDEATVLLGDREVSTVDLLAAVLGAVARAAVEATGFLPPAAVTYPATWGPSRRQVLAAAANRAGWPPVRFVPEPVAAARYFADVLRRPVPVGASIAVFDFGGGTLDIAVVQNTGNGFGVLGAGGIEDLGGLDVDAVLVDHLGRLLADTAPSAWTTITNPDTTSQLRDRGRFWEDVRGAKEMLSRTAAAPVAVPGLDQAIHLTREELDRVAGPLIQRAVYETGAVISRCGLRPDQLAGLFLVGGSSRLPIAARLLHAHLGIAPTVLEQPELPVAEGAVAELVPPMTSPAMAPSAPPPAGMPGPPIAVSPAAVSPATVSPATVSPAAVSPAAVSPVAGSPAAGPPTSAPPVSPLAAPFAPTGSAQFLPPSPPPPPPPDPPETAGSGTMTYPSPTAAPPRPWYRRPVTWIVAGALAVALVVAGTLVLALGDRYPQVSFTSLSEVAQVPMGVESPSYTFTAVNGDRAYLALQKDNAVRVTGYDLAGRQQRWTETVTPEGVSSVTFEGLAALADSVVGVATLSGGSASRILFGVDWAGHHVWRHDLTSSDKFLATSAALLIVDSQNHQLVGLDPRTGNQKWTLANIKDSGDSSSATFPIYSDADLAQPGPLPEGPEAPTSDTRVVQIGADNSARVIDTATGKIIVTEGNVGDYSSVTLAAGGRLYVASSSGGYKLFSYDLGSLADGKLIYTAPDDTHYLKDIVPCGSRVCLLDEPNSDDKGDQVLAVNPGGNVAWQKPAPGASALTPLGGGLLVDGSGSSRYATVFDDNGKVLLGDEGKDQTGVRVTAGSVLLFSDTPESSPNDETLTGLAARDGTRTPLGQIKKVRAAACSWNTRMLVCPTESDFGIWRFAS
jgi:molecular chaperone HscA